MKTALLVLAVAVLAAARARDAFAEARPEAVWKLAHVMARELGPMPQETRRALGQVSTGRQVGVFEAGDRGLAVLACDGRGCRRTLAVFSREALLAAGFVRMSVTRGKLSYSALMNQDAAPAGAVTLEDYDAAGALLMDGAFFQALSQALDMDARDRAAARARALGESTGAVLQYGR